MQAISKTSVLSRLRTSAEVGKIEIQLIADITNIAWATVRNYAILDGLKNLTIVRGGCWNGNISAGRIMKGKKAKVVVVKPILHQVVVEVIFQTGHDGS